ncbi:O-antigen ligase family protein [Candidatus Parcubacteria bacterium]|nr:O-antigen ligase family protein [Candidatus Parcubacteria bacterium]
MTETLLGVRYLFALPAALAVGVGAALAPVAAVVAAGLTATVLGMRTRAGWVLAAGILLLPITPALNPWPGFDVAVSRLWIPATVLLWPRKSRPNQLLFWLGLAVVWGALSALWAGGSAVWAVRKAFVWATLWPLAFAVYWWLREGEGAERAFVRAIAGAGVLAAGAALIGWLGSAAFWLARVTPLFAGATVAETVQSFSSWFVHVGGRDVLRAVGTLPDPHTLGAVLVVALPFMAVVWQSAVRPRQKAAWFASMVLAVGIIALTFSRSAYAGLAAAGFVAACRLGRKFVLIFSATAALTFAVPFVGERTLVAVDLGEGSNAERLVAWRTGFATAVTHPLGVGLGNYPLLVRSEGDFTYRTPVSTHNTYLELAAETGVVGLGLWLALLGGAFFALGRASPAPSAMAGLASLIGFAVLSFFDIMMFSPVVVPLVAAVLGYAAAAARKQQT